MTPTRHAPDKHTTALVARPLFAVYFILIFILIYLCRVKYAAIEADLYTALPKQKLNNLLTVI